MAESPAGVHYKTRACTQCPRRIWRFELPKPGGDIPTIPGEHDHGLGGEVVHVLFRRHVCQTQPAPGSRLCEKSEKEKGQPKASAGATLEPPSIVWLATWCARVLCDIKRRRCYKAHPQPTARILPPGRKRTARFRFLPLLEDVWKLIELSCPPPEVRRPVPHSG